MSLLSDPAFSVPFEAIKRELAKKQNGEEINQIMQTTLFKLLMDGVEELSKEVEILIQNPESINSEVRERFNPCIYLGYLIIYKTLSKIILNEKQSKQMINQYKKQNYNQMIRRIFWNFRNSFFGKDMLVLIPYELAKFPVGFVGFYLFYQIAIVDKNFYDLHDGDVIEAEFLKQQK